MKKRLNFVGRSFGRLSVIADGGREGVTTWWICRCECGAEKRIRHGQLTSGKTVSCGCYARELKGRSNFKHGMRNSPEFKSWTEAKQRCRLDGPKRKWYADRGITICEEWAKDFLTFYKDMGPRPEGTTLDRIDNDGPYAPWNCRWATKDTQANNKRSNRMIEAFGKRQTLAQWARETGIKLGTIWARLDVAKWSPERALTEKRYGVRT